jgi:hypothetical protein
MLVDKKAAAQRAFFALWRLRVCGVLSKPGGDLNRTSFCEMKYAQIGSKQSELIDAKFVRAHVPDREKTAVKNHSRRSRPRAYQQSPKLL